jgi:PAS domain-containing protein
MAGAFDRAVGILSRLLPTGIVGRWSKEGAPPTAAVDHGRPLRGTPVGDLGAFVDSVPVLLATVDATGRCRFANRACEEWFGSPRGGLVGKHLREVLGERCWR